MKKLLFALVAVMAACLLAVSVFAEAAPTTEELTAQGWTAYESKDYEAALAAYTEAAAQGSADALNMLGYMYWQGNGVEVDYNQALAYYQQAIDAGYDEAFVGYRMGSIYAAMEQYDQARETLVMAAALGDMDSTVLLGDLYREGKGVEADMNAALKWYRVHANDYQISAFRAASILYQSKRYAETATVCEKALMLKPTASSSQLATANYTLAEIYFHGMGDVAQDYAKGVAYHQAAYELGTPSSLPDLVDAYLNGWGVEADQETAWSYLEKYVETGADDVATRLGSYYYKTENYQAAFDAFVQGAETDNSYCMTMLGYFYEYGTGDVVQIDLNTARTWYEKALTLDPESDWLKNAIERVKGE